MGTLYECLREARLEQFYPAFRANGITRSEALINLGMPEFCALGITSSEDKRRLIELVNIIKSVHNSGLSDSPTPQHRNSGSRQQYFAYSSNTASSNIDSSPSVARGTSSSRARTRPVSRGSSQHETATPDDMHLEPPREGSSQDRVPNFSVASYMDMLQYLSDSSESDEAVDVSDEDQPVAQARARNVSSPSTVRTSSVRGPTVERVKHTRNKGYNYGVHKVGTPQKTKPSKPGSHKNTGDDKIKVCVRKRPLTRREQRAKDEDVVMVESTNALIVNEPKLAVDLTAFTLQHEFIFDEVFDETCSNEDVYIRAARPLISCIFNGGTATCFAYGQTGAGKTHTMLGDENVPGLYLLAGQDIFSIIHSGQYGRGLHVWVSFFEIYCGQLFDLLNRRNRLHAREDGSKQVCIAGLTETEATSVTSLVQTLEYGNSVRSKGATGVNPDSSRSHAILQLDIRNSEDLKVGKISFIDLAGSERASDVTDTDKQTRMEGAEINQSLLALKECIRSIDQDSRHTPFRQSKLTHILKDSFVGNSRTCMIANISPTQTACENTLNTLRYADRVKELKRDSTRSCSVGQAMNLLMNIPPTAPSIFHPSNILSTSTPMRPGTQSRRERTNPSSSELVLDPSETPIRGHHMPRRSAAKDSSRGRQAQASVTKTRAEQLSVVSPTPRVPPGTSTRSSAHATDASQGASAPPPDASPSESDHTDTDSCNVTNPTYTKASPSGRQLPVVKSTDTEFDFPTSDFNNIDDMNDLNRTDTQQQKPLTSKESHLPSQPRDDPGMSAAAAAETVVTATVSIGKRVVPVVKPVLYRSTDASAEAGSAGTPPMTSHASDITQKFHSSEVTTPQPSKHPPSFKKLSVKDLVSSDESVDEEDLMRDGPSSIPPERMNNLAAPPSDSKATPQMSKPIPVSIMNKHAMIPLPADSSDLTKFTQRPALKAPEPPAATVKNDIAPKPGPSHMSQQHETTVPRTEQVSQKPSPPLSQPSRKSPTSKLKSPDRQIRAQIGKPPHQDNTTDSTVPASGSQHHQQSSRQLPWIRRKSPTASDVPCPVPSPPFQQASGSPCVPSSPNEDTSQNSSLRRHSDGSDPGRPHKISQSPTGEISDDSTDSIRASLSDQGQSGYRHHREGHRSNMRKERSDPMLALNMQRKKQTLPDPQHFSKMLTRSNTPKSGLAHRDAGWKVVHNELPSHKVGSVEATMGGGDCHSEPSSMVTVDPENPYADQQEHFSDGNNYAAARTTDSTPSVTTSKSGRAKQLPQVPVSTQEVSKDEALPSGTSGDPPAEGTVKINPAIITEKLSSGAMFAPIHPQPVTSVGTKSVAEPATASSLLLQPTPVTAASTSNVGMVMGTRLSSQEEINAGMLEARMKLISEHEDQLATVTSLCKYEMRLLLNAKKVSGRRGFDDYLRRVSEILQQKMSAIASLHDQISTYRSSYSQSSSVLSSVAASVAVSESDLANNFSHK